MPDLEYISQKAKEFGGAASAVVDTSEIHFVPEFRRSCEMNSCGYFGKNWMCPPAVGSPEELKAKVLEFTQGVVVQSVSSLQDSFDFEGMQRAEEEHEILFRCLFDFIHSIGDFGAFLPLNVGACKFCKECSFASGKPCPFPDKSVASLEAYCIDVNALLTTYSIPYNNGPDTVSYVSLFLIA